jgi:quinohemoprotein ethanol dehydrogenase
MVRVKLDQIRIPPTSCGLAFIRAAVMLWAIASAPAMAQDRAAIEAGEQVYDEHCASCHGPKLRPTGAFPDLKQQKADGRARFDQVVMNGKNQMPAWQGVVSPEELDQIWAYIRSRAADR